MVIRKGWAAANREVSHRVGGSVDYHWHWSLKIMGIEASWIDVKQ